MKRRALLAPSLLATLLLAGSASAVSKAPSAKESLLRLDGSRVPLSELDARIPELMAKVWLPGLSVAVIQDGAIAYRRSFGVRDVRTGKPITADTSFTGLSFSKTITAYLAMRLVEAGRLDLDEPLYRYLAKPVTEYDFYRDLEGDTRHRALTARHVLSHTTGWPNWRWLTEEDRLTFLFEPGERHSYSGEGFAYLQLAVEEISGKSFEELAQREVFGPLDMADSSMVWQERFEANFAEDHDLLGRPLDRERWEEAGAAGSLQTTLGDYARFLVAVMHSQGLSPASRDAMLAPQVAIRHEGMFGPRATAATDRHQKTGLSWTLGWGSVLSPWGRAVFHTGNDRGSANYAIAFPDRRAAVVLMGNSNRLEGIAEDLVKLLLADRSSPFDFLGYERWDAPKQTWLRRLAEGGLEAGRSYWTSLSPAERTRGELDDEDAFAFGGEALLHFGHEQDEVGLQQWRRELFPQSIDAVKELAGAWIRRGQAGKGLEVLSQARAKAASGSPEAAQLGWLQGWAQALAEPHSIQPDRLESFAGDYEVRHVELRGDQLYYGRGEIPPERYLPLVPMSDDTFVIESLDFFRLRFELDAEGRAVRVHGLYDDGRTDSNPRTSPLRGDGG